MDLKVLIAIMALSLVTMAGVSVYSVKRPVPVQVIEITPVATPTLTATPSAVLSVTPVVKLKLTPK